jgi:hypothetical protein
VVGEVRRRIQTYLASGVVGEEQKERFRTGTNQASEEPLVASVGVVEAWLPEESVRSQVRGWECRDQSLVAATGAN